MLMRGCPGAAVVGQHHSNSAQIQPPAAASSSDGSSSSKLESSALPLSSSRRQPGPSRQLPRKATARSCRTQQQLPSSLAPPPAPVQPPPFAVLAAAAERALRCCAARRSSWTRSKFRDGRRLARPSWIYAPDGGVARGVQWCVCHARRRQSSRHLVRAAPRLAHAASYYYIAATCSWAVMSLRILI